ncbi:MAG TPA: hypothetical protein VMN99_14990, partial [Anaerolineales bacterium]|nr:hypothetical protein [Anaerolineales bacterium]
PLSDPSNIIVDDDKTAKLPFLAEPEHTWCYYFAKAELAYQHRDWDQVVDLIDQAKSFGYEPEDPFEWLTYIEAQARTGNIEAAQKLSNEVLRPDNGLRRGLCELWKRVQAQGLLGGVADTRVNQILSGFQCTR